MYAAIRDATIRAAAVQKIRIVHMSIQRTHLHLVVETGSRGDLAKGMQSFLISAARLVNAALSRRAGEKRRGGVFGDRYHATVLKTPRQVRNCVAYVLNNWRHHDEDRDRAWKLDPFSSAVSFHGWRELEDATVGYRVRPTYRALVVWFPRTWLLAEGWRRHGRIGAFRRTWRRRIAT